MTDERIERMQAHIAELWSETFGEQPAIAADPETMIRILVECLQDVGPWELSKAPSKAALNLGIQRLGDP